MEDHSGWAAAFMAVVSGGIRLRHMDQSPGDFTLPSGALSHTLLTVQC